LSTTLLDVASLPSIFDEMSQMWQVDPQRLPIPADLPRLARRIAFRLADDYPDLASYAESPAVVLDPPHTDYDGADVDDAETKRDEERRTQRARRQRLADVVMCSAKSVHRRLSESHAGPEQAEDDEELQQLEQVVERLEEMMARFVEENGADGQLALMSILQDSGAYACAPLMGLFKLIQQRSIYAPAFRIKIFLRELGLMTKDMHGPNAWRILVDFERDGHQRRASDDNEETEVEREEATEERREEEGEVVVTHTRRERSSADPEEDPEHYFEVEWRLTLVTDRRLSALVRVGLTVLAFDPHPRMPAPLRAHIREALTRCCAL
jgi:hypothetical protein